ncbi:MAG: polysaccharide biosynthesis tyrosine autokinase [Deltaproteobacteria bacterium]|nr:polysaccharide biosynthesis tyrosine autokinase [Deltaproteobacteria bacterium]
MSDSEPRRRETIDSIDRVAERHFYDYLGVVLRRIYAAIAAFVVVSGLYIYGNVYAKVSIYEAQAMLRVKRPEGKAGSIQFFSLSFSDIPAEIQVIKSRLLATRVVERLGMHWEALPGPNQPKFKFEQLRTPRELKELLFELTSPTTFMVRNAEGTKLTSGKVGEVVTEGPFQIHVTEASGEPGQVLRLRAGSPEKKADLIRRGLAVTETQARSNVLRLLFRSPNRALAARVPNEFAQVYIDWCIEQQSEEAGLSLDFIEKTLDETRRSLDIAEGGFRAFQAEKGVLSVDAAAQGKVTVIAENEQEREARVLARRQLSVARASLELAMKEGSRSPAGPAGHPIADRIAAQLGEAEFELETKSAELLPTHPDLKALRDKKSTLQRQLLRAYEDEDTLLGDQIAAFDARLKALRGELKLLPEAEREFIRLSREAKYIGDTYTFLLQKREEAKIAKAATVSRVNLLELAVPPTVPVSPDKPKGVVTGLLIALVVAIGFAFLVDYLDDSVRDPERVSKDLDLPLLGMVPWFPRQKGTESPLVSVADPTSISSEAFRTIRTNVQFAGLGGASKLLVVTSPLPNEGKSTIAANLAVAFARTGNKVLLVGCDLRKPTLHELFPLPRSPGLSEVLVSAAQIEAAIRPSGIEHLDVLLAGTTPPNPLELLESPRAQELFTAFRQTYDTIILDAPPVLPVADATVLCKVSDLVLLVLGVGLSPRKATERMAENLRRAGARLAGYVFNDPRKRFQSLGQRYGYRGYAYGYYYYASSYGPAPQKKPEAPPKHG